MTHRRTQRLAFVLLLALLFTQAVVPVDAMVRVDDPVGPSPATAEASLPQAPAAFPLVATADPVVAWMVSQVDQDTLYQYTGDLSGEWPVTLRGNTVTITSRNTNSGAPIQNATNFVGDHLAGRGLTVEYHRWGPSAAPNVIGQKTGATAPGDIFLITAHLDDMPSGSTAPGADDNASGSVGVLVAADILSQFQWNCTLRFALWTGEEQGLLGSDKYAQRAKNNGENIKGVLNLDMIAWNTAGSAPDVDLNANKDLPATVDLANQMASVIDAYDLNLIPQVLDYGEGASDHASFWKQGYPAILGIEDYYPSNHDFSPYYHKTSDKLSTLNMPYFTEFVKAAVAETAHMSSCLTTGISQGRISAEHDGAPVAGAEIALTDAAGRTYILKSNTAGGYNQAVPPGTYSAVVSAYGYGNANAAGVVVTANGSTTTDFTLTAPAPVAPTANVGLDSGEVKLSWLHVSPDTAYTVRRSNAAYFDPATGEVVTTVEAAHPPAQGETLSWRDAQSGAGDPAANHFYVVLGQNAAGAGAASNRVGEFDFALVKP
jgi:Zn-dependent M28 family amino/carboxypeptidase